MGRQKLISRMEANSIAFNLPYQQSTSLRVFADGTWIAPANAPQVDNGLQYWNYRWTVDGYISSEREEVEQ